MRRCYSGVFFLILLIACAGVGNEPIPGQPAHHVVGGFRNTNSDFRRPSTWTRWSFVVRRLWTTSISPRTFDAPRVSNDGALLACRQCESEHYLDWPLDAVGTDQRREYSNRPAVERTSKSGVLGRPAPSKPSRARIRRFAADRCCLDLSRSLRPSGSKHRKAPCRGARSALFGSARSQGVVCRERNDTGRRDGLVAGARIWRREIRLRAGSAFFPTNIVGRERTTLGVVGGVEPRATALFLG